MKLTNYKILVLPEPKKTDSLIILSEKDQKDDDGKVVLIGEKVDWLKPGDKIRKYHQVKGVPIDYNGQDCILLNADPNNCEIEFKL